MYYGVNDELFCLFQVNQFNIAYDVKKKKLAEILNS